MNQRTSPLDYLKTVLWGIGEEHFIKRLSSFKKSKGLNKRSAITIGSHKITFDVRNRSQYTCNKKDMDEHTYLFTVLDDFLLFKSNISEYMSLMEKYVIPTRKLSNAVFQIVNEKNHTGLEEYVDFPKSVIERLHSHESYFLSIKASNLII